MGVIKDMIKIIIITVQIGILLKLVLPLVSASAIPIDSTLPTIVPSSPNSTDNNEHSSDPQAEAEERMIMPPKFPYSAPFGYYSSGLLCLFTDTPYVGGWFGRSCQGPLPPFTLPTPPPSGPADPTDPPRVPGRMNFLEGYYGFPWVTPTPPTPPTPFPIPPGFPPNATDATGNSTADTNSTMIPTPLPFIPPNLTRRPRPRPIIPGQTGSLGGGHGGSTGLRGGGGYDQMGSLGGWHGQMSTFGGGPGQLGLLGGGNYGHGFSWQTSPPPPTVRPPTRPRPRPTTTTVGTTSPTSTTSTTTTTTTTTTTSTSTTSTAKPSSIPTTIESLPAPLPQIMAYFPYPQPAPLVPVMPGFYQERPHNPEQYADYGEPVEGNPWEPDDEELFIENYGIRASKPGFRLGDPNFKKRVRS